LQLTKQTFILNILHQSNCQGKVMNFFSRFKTVVLISVLMLAVAGCSDKKDFSKQQYIMNAWSQAIKNRDYTAYSKIEAHPKQPDQFMEMYKDYYPAEIFVVDVTKPSKERIDAEQKKCISRTVSFCVDIIMRKDGSKIPSTGSVELVQYTEGQGSWLIADKTIIRSK